MLNYNYGHVLLINQVIFLLSLQKNIKCSSNTIHVYKAYHVRSIIVRARCEVSAVQTVENAIGGNPLVLAGTALCRNAFDVLNTGELCLQCGHYGDQNFVCCVNVF